jgi:peptidoglycan/xylan/chitin deacetylase (PgdA/CDA1 family)
MTPHQARTHDRKVITLAFHSVTNCITYGSTNYSPRRLSRLLAHLKVGEHASRAASIQLTFDDGYAHLLDILPDLIARNNIRPIVFFPTAFMGKSNSWDYGGQLRNMRHLDVDEIQSLAKAGVIFGSHGHSHCDLTSLSDGEIVEELSVSREILSDIVQTSVTDLSYPFGKQSSRVESAAAACGYRAGYTMSFPKGDDSPLKRGRIPIYFFDSMKSVSAKISGRGLRFTFERVRTVAAQKLSVGTVILQFLRGRKSNDRP